MIPFLALWSPPAVAQDVVAGGDTPDLNAQTFRPTLDGTRTLWTDDASVPVEGPSGRVLLSYTDDPLVYLVEGQEEVGLVTSVVQADVMGGWAFGPARIGLDVPIYLFALGDVTGGEAGLGDLAVDGRVTVFGGEGAPVEAPVDVGLQARLGLPTATVQGALGSPGVGYEVALVGSKEIGDVLLAANVGTRGSPGSALENVTLNDDFVWRGGVGYAVTDTAGVAGEITGQIDYASPIDNPAGLPIEAMLSGYGRASDDVVVRGGVGRGLTAGIGSPDLRLVVGVAYEPLGTPKDTDMDGLVDKEDVCPTEPEDKDSFEDTDGCPDPDNDMDGLLDVADACPMDPEDKDAYKDEDGCPDPNTMLSIQVTDEDGRILDLSKATIEGPSIDKPFAGGELKMEVPPGTYVLSGRAGTYEPNTATLEVVDGPPQNLVVALAKQKNVKIVVTRDRIDLKDKVYFETARATIKSESFDLLDQAVQILVDYPEIQLLRIEGHTDSRGGDAYNLELSKKRAASVLEYFVTKGVDAQRLTSEGFGEEKPLDPAENTEAWAKNRRVDFFIERWED